MKTFTGFIVALALAGFPYRHSPAQDAPIQNVSPKGGSLKEPSTKGTPQNIGISRIYDVILPGGEIEPIPQEDRKAPIVLRMEKVDPTENGFHYRISCIGLEAGKFDLRKYLRWKDRQITSPIPDRPEWHVEIISILPPGQVVPREMEQKTTIRLGGYKYLVAGLVLFWGLGLLAIILWPGPKPMFRKSKKPLPTVADLLRPLIEKALEGDLSPASQASLERTLMGFWRQRLKLEKTEPIQALAKLKAHPEAGELLRNLEEWLHRPPDKRPAMDVDALLRPYRKVQAETISTLEKIPGGSSS